jgi:hypothetical protein
LSKLFAIVAATVGITLAAGAYGAYAYSTRDVPPSAEVTSATDRHMKKYEVVCEVIDGKQSLAQAATAFRQLNAGVAGIDDVYPGDSEGERLGKQVIALVRDELKQRGEDTADVLARLEAELKAARQKDGKVVLQVTAD